MFKIILIILCYFCGLTLQKQSPKNTTGKLTKYECINPESCCIDRPIQNFLTSFGDNRMSEECFKEWASKNNGTRRNRLTLGDLFDSQFPFIGYIFDCIGRRKGFLQIDGKINKKQFVKDIKERLESVTWLSPKIESMVESCLKKLETDSNGMKFWSAVIIVGYCVWKDIQLMCPIEMQGDKVKCPDFQEYIRNDKQFPPPPEIVC